MKPTSPSGVVAEWDAIGAGAVEGDPPPFKGAACFSTRYNWAISNPTTHTIKLQRPSTVRNFWFG